ncbi:LysR family transcriptional regulator [Tropicimonas sp.]|uniref:LysR family transcriptional regulator n=1 Tax=Tropicimonas sp. TaxID=2067044 RepID=UPI003A88DE8F
MPKQRLSLRQLRALVAVVETGAITHAAGRLNLTTPAVHTQLKILEDFLDIPLLTRPRGEAMTPTDAGQLLYDAAARIDGELDRALRDIAALRSGHEGRVHIGVVSTGKYFAPRIVARLRRLHPGIVINLSVGNRQAIIGMLQRRSLHLAIMGRPPREPLVTALAIAPHPHVIIAAPDHPLAGIGKVPLAALLGETFIMREEGSGTRILANRFLDRIGGDRCTETIDMDSNETIKQAVMAGLGIAMISEHTVTEELRNRRIVRLEAEGLPIVRQWFLLHPEDTPLSASAARIKAEISLMRDTIFPAMPTEAVQAERK